MLKIRTHREIENLIRLHDVTISDLPQPDGNKTAYDFARCVVAEDMSRIWHGGGWNSMPDFICHQSDVIERLCDALQSANESVESLRECVECMMEDVQPFEDQVDTGFYKACRDVLDFIEEIFWLKKEDEEDG